MHLTPDQNARLREAMLTAIKERFESRARLAHAMGMSAPAISDFLNGKGGASMETAETFAQKIARRPVEDVIGKRKIENAVVVPIGSRAPQTRTFYPVSPETRRKAIVLLLQPPQKFSMEAITIGLESIKIDVEEDATNPAAVAELVREAILGSVAKYPQRGEQPPSDRPPLNTRRSRRG